MLRALLFSFRRVAGLTGSAIQDPTFDAIGGAVVMLAASGWELAKALIAHPEGLVIWPMAAAFIVLVGGILFSVGALVWLIWVLTVAVGRSLLTEKIRPGQAWPAIVGTVVVLLFLGVPELGEKFTWWQEHLASWQEHYFNRIPGEPAALAACQNFIQSFSNRDSIIGLIFMALIGLLVFLLVRQHFPDKLHRATMTIKRLVTGRKWLVPGGSYHRDCADHWSSGLFSFTLAPSDTVLRSDRELMWLLVPVIRHDLFSIVVAVVLLIPALIVTSRIGGSWSLLWLAVSALLWGAWLFCSIGFHAWPWRIVFWAGAFAFGGYIVCGPGAV